MNQNVRNPKVELHLNTPKFGTVYQIVLYLRHRNRYVLKWMGCLHEWLTFSAITAQQFCGPNKYFHQTRIRKRVSKKFLNSLFLFDITYAIDKLKECIACKLLPVFISSKLSSF